MNGRLLLRIERIEKLVADAAGFSFSVQNRPVPDYRPGQFLTLIFYFNGHETRRSYSLSSLPLMDEYLTIGVKRISNGLVSRYMLDKLKTGDIIEALPPHGKFIPVKTATVKKLVFFAAGSGIVPVYAHLKHYLGQKKPPALYLFYSNVSEASTLYFKELILLEKNSNGRLHIRFLFSSPVSESYQRHRLSNTDVEEWVTEISGTSIGESLFYLCGPFAYMRMIQLTLHYLGVDDERIKRENFVVETAAGKTGQHHFVRQKITIRFNGRAYPLVVEPTQSILDAALSGKILLPYSCKGGVCSTCTAQCISGKVEMTINDVLSPADLKNGQILTCTGHPVTGDVVIEFP